MRCAVGDNAAVRNLEIVKNMSEGKKYGSLLWLLDKTKTAMGARLLQNILLSPLGSAQAINYRLDGVEELFESTVVRVGIGETLSEVRDIERITGKIACGSVMPADCLTLACSLLAVPNLRFQLSGFSSAALNDISRELVDETQLAQHILNVISEKPPATLKDGGYIKEGFDKQLDELRSVKKNSKDILYSAIISKSANRSRTRSRPSISADRLLPMPKGISPKS